MAASQKILNKAKKWHQCWWGLIFLIACAILSVYVGVFIYQLVFYIEIENQAKAKAYEYFFNPDLNSGLNFREMLETTDDPYFGFQQAELVIVEFADFQCPFCKEAYLTVKKIREEYQDRVKIIYRDLPDLTSHPDALNAAIAAECADEQGRFWPYHDKLFANQNNLTVENLKLLATQSGLNLSQFNQCLDNNKYAAEVQNDLQDGLKFGIIGTPTFFINGNKVPGNIPYETFKSIIEKILQGQDNLNL